MNAAPPSYWPCLRVSDRSCGELGGDGGGGLGDGGEGDGGGGDGGGGDGGGGDGGTGVGDGNGGRKKKL